EQKRSRSEQKRAAIRAGSDQHASTSEHIRTNGAARRQFRPPFVSAPPCLCGFRILAKKPKNPAPFQQFCPPTPQNPTPFQTFQSRPDKPSAISTFPERIFFERPKKIVRPNHLSLRP